MDLVVHVLGNFVELFLNVQPQCSHERVLMWVRSYFDRLKKLSS